MQKSQLVQLIRHFSPVELRDIRKFIHSPFFNQRKDLIELFEWICKNEVPDKLLFWQHLYGQTPFVESKLRLLMSYLYRLLEQYLAVRALTEEPHHQQLFLAIAYRKRTLGDAFLRTKQELEKQLESKPLRNSDYYECLFRLGWESHQMALVDKPTEAGILRTLSDTIDVVYLSQKLRIICLLTAQQKVYQTGQFGMWDEEIMQLSHRPEWSGIPAISVYQSCYQMLRNPLDEVHFYDFKQILLLKASHFNNEEMHGLYILAINYCVMRLNEGASRFFQEVFELYKSGLENAYLLDHGVLSRFTYHNIVAAGIHCREADWVRAFIFEYKNRLEKKYRESSFSFNLARLEFSTNRYDSVLELLQHANYRDPLLNLAAKTLLLKTFYEMNNLDLLSSHLDAMRNYIHRKKVIGYHKSNYLNIIRFMEKLLRLNFHDKKTREALEDAIRQEPVLTEKEFLLKIVTQQKSDSQRIKN